MKKLLALLMAFFPGLAKSEPAKLGSDGDLIRQMLFASQSLKEQVKQMHLDGNPGPFQTIADAAQLVEAGKREAAIARLHSVLDMPELETRIVLWTWSALRELGEKPDPKFAYQVIGAVIEVPSGGAYDTLAGYMDGSARYLNFSGRAIFWDLKDEKLRALCQAFIDSTVPASARAKPRTSLALPRHGAQVTLLTRSGIYVIPDPPDSVVGPATSLMLELIRRTSENKANQAPEPTASGRGSS